MYWAKFKRAESNVRDLLPVFHKLICIRCAARKQLNEDLQKII